MTVKEIDETYTELINAIIRKWAATQEKTLYMNALITTLRDYVIFKEIEDELLRTEHGKTHES